MLFHSCANWLYRITAADIAFDHLIGSHNGIALLYVLNRFWVAVKFFGTEA